jgi:hypothetical protein
LRRDLSGKEKDGIGDNRQTIIDQEIRGEIMKTRDNRKREG